MMTSLFNQNKAVLRYYDLFIVNLGYIDTTYLFTNTLDYTLDYKYIKMSNTLGGLCSKKRKNKIRDHDFVQEK